MYLLDGLEVSYEACLLAVVSALEEGESVSHAYHRGADCYWVDGEHPWYAKPVELTDEGVRAGDRIIESLLAS